MRRKLPLWSIRSPEFVALALAIGAICAGATTADRQELQARQAKIESLSPAERQQLLRNEQRFAALTTVEQDRLRKLADELENDPAEARLKQVLARYHEWLKTLTPGERADLLELPIADRVERIKQIKDRQARMRPRKPANREELSPEDLRTIVRWFDDTIWKHRQEIIKTLGPDAAEKIAQMSEQEQRGYMPLFVWGRLHRRGDDLSPMFSAEADTLVEQLSQPAAALWKNTAEGERRQVLRQWLRAAFADRMDRMGPGRKMALASNEEIESFFEKSLPAGERERLLNMPRDQMQRELRRLYVLYSQRPEFPASRGGAGKQAGRGKNMHRPGDGVPDEERRGPRDGKQFRKGPPDKAPPPEREKSPPIDEHREQPKPDDERGKSESTE